MTDPENISPYGAQNHPLQSTEDLQARKINSMTHPDEITGWIWGLAITGRKMTPLEKIALEKKAQALGVRL